jgi:8-oxo-dGTP pyrophosphatase MutT (NUDIX family)
MGTPPADPAAELIAIYDADGTPIGAAPRGEVYARRWWHAATAVLVRSGDGERVYVHRRSPAKLIFPGLHDCFAGGVVGAGEQPAAGAARELAEELGITGVAPRPLFRMRFSGDVRYVGHVYDVRWDGPVLHQPEEVAGGGWLGLPELRALLADPAYPFVPDGRQFFAEWDRRYGRES